MSRVVARFEPPLSDGLKAAVAAFDCVQIMRDGDADPGEVMVRDFLRSGDFQETALSGTTTTYMVINPEEAPGRVIGYVTLAFTQIRLSGGEIKRGQGLRSAGRSDFGALRIAMIGVDREFSGDGYGKLLIDTVVQHAARISRDVSVRFVVADAVATRIKWYGRQGFVENNSQMERERLARTTERTGVPATSMRLDLGPDPRSWLITPAS